MSQFDDTVYLKPMNDSETRIEVNGSAPAERVRTSSFEESDTPNRPQTPKERWKRAIRAATNTFKVNKKKNENFKLKIQKTSPDQT